MGKRKRKHSGDAVSKGTEEKVVEGGEQPVEGGDKAVEEAQKAEHKYKAKYKKCRALAITEREEMAAEKAELLEAKEASSAELQRLQKEVTDGQKKLEREKKNHADAKERLKAAKEEVRSLKGDLATAKEAAKAAPAKAAPAKEVPLSKAALAKVSQSHPNHEGKLHWGDPATMTDRLNALDQGQEGQDYKVIRSPTPMLFIDGCETHGYFTECGTNFKTPLFMKYPQEYVAEAFKYATEAVKKQRGGGKWGKDGATFTEMVTALVYTFWKGSQAPFYNNGVLLCFV